MPKLLTVVLALTVFGCEIGPSNPPDEAARAGSGTAAPAATAAAASTYQAPGPVGHVVIPFADDPADRSTDVAIVDPAGALTGWRAATAGELRGVRWGAGGDVGIGALGEREIVVGWIATICDREATATFEASRLVIAPAPRDGCDAMAIARGMVLTLATPINPESLDVVLLPTELLPEADD